MKHPNQNPVPSPNEDHFRSSYVIFAMLGIAGLLSVLVSACSPKSDFTNEGAAISAGVIQQKVISNFDLNSSRRIVITVDDGPTPVLSGRLLDLLKKENVHASFFLIGANIKGNEAIVKRMQQEGHVIGNHSMTHPNLSNPIYAQNPALVAKELLDADLLIRPYLKSQKRPYFRPPGGHWLPQFAALLNTDSLLKSYVGPIFWNIGGQLTFDRQGQVENAADWACWAPRYSIPLDECVQGYLNEIAGHGGGVMLMHDKSQKSIDLLAKLIPLLKAQGYEFVTLDNLPELDALR